MDSFSSAKKTFGPSPAVSPTSVLPFVKFIDNKLTLDDVPLDTMTDVKVVSILGKARMGKSTFLNAVVSKVTQENHTVFATQGGIEHCTYGIDYCFIPEKKLLLLDSQGLANGDARHDPALLLFLYMVSDAIVFNDSKILQNEALKLIEPVCAFMTYIEDLDAIVKPSLIFRLSDAELVKDTQKNLDNVMASHPDQYQSIRESITHLFKTPLTLVKTELLDRKEKALLESGEYLQLLSESENGFNSAIQHILTTLASSEPRPGIMSRLPQIIENINTNQKIKIEKLDIVAMVADKDILEWVAEIDPALYAPIPVDGTQASYDELVEPRKKKRTALMASFRRRFKGVPDSIREKHLVSFAAKLNDPIQKAILKSEEKATGILQSFLTKANEERTLPVIQSSSYAFTHMKEEELKAKYLTPYEKLKEACKSVYCKVKEEQEAWIQRLYEIFFKGIEECKAVEVAEREAVRKFCEDILESFEAKAVEECKTLESIGSPALPTKHRILNLENEEILKRWLLTKIAEVQQFIQVSVTSKSLAYRVKDGMLSYTQASSDTPIYHTHELIADIYTNFADKLTAIVSNSSLLVEALIARKESLLENTLINEYLLTGMIQRANPEITFVWDEILPQTMLSDVNTTSKLPYMTLRTWNSVYKPLYDEVVEDMKTSGYLRATCAPHENCEGDSLCVLSMKKEGNMQSIEAFASETPYTKNISEILLRKLRKLYCKKVCEGMVFPKVSLRFT